MWAPKSKKKGVPRRGQKMSGKKVTRVWTGQGRERPRKLGNGRGGPYNEHRNNPLDTGKLEKWNLRSKIWKLSTGKLERKKCDASQLALWRIWIDWLFGWLVDWLIGWLVDWLIVWWIGWLFDGLVDCLVDCFARAQMGPKMHQLGATIHEVGIQIPPSPKATQIGPRRSLQIVGASKTLSTIKKLSPLKKLAPQKKCRHNKKVVDTS